MQKQSVFIVIPTIRNLTFLKDWQSEFKSCNAVIVEDHKDQKIDTPTGFFKRIYHFTWKNIRNDFGPDEWIFSRRNAGIRSYGFWKAYALGADVIITLDDDCYPAENDFVKKHVDNLAFKAARNWFSTYPNPKFMYTRGFPYSVRDKLPVAISHGLWSGALDLDAKTEVKLPKLLNEKPYPPVRQVVPRGYFFPMCSMNLAFTRMITPLMYFPPMGFDPQGNHWGYDRYDDIWAGLFVKVICDYLALAIVNGSPFVRHTKASSLQENVKKEQKGLRMNETLWQTLTRVNLTQSTPKACFKQLMQQVKFPESRYFKKLIQAVNLWLSYFD